MGLGSKYKMPRKLAARRQSLNQKQVSKVKRIVKRQVMSMNEWKHHVLDVPGDAISTSGQVTDLSAVAQGDTDVTRDGDEINAHSISIRYSWTCPDTTNVVRVIIFQWLPDSTPVIANILNPLTAGLETESHYNTDKADQFKILFDKTQVSYQAVSAQNHSPPYVRRKLRLRKKKIKFNAGATDGSGKVYLLALTDSGVTTHPTLYFESRLNFMDS